MKYGDTLRLIGLCLLSVGANLCAEPCQGFEDLRRDLITFVRARYPAITIENTETELQVRLNTRKFLIHEPTMNGEWQEAFEVEGPKPKGLMARVTLAPGLYGGQAVTPQRWDKRYFVEELHTPFSRRCQAHVQATLFTPPATDPRLVQDFFALVDGFSE